MRHWRNSHGPCRTRSGPETQRDAVQRAIATGPFASPSRRIGDRARPGRPVARRTGVAAADRLRDLAARRAVRLTERAAGAGAVGALAMPGDEGFRLIELVDVLMAAPPNIANASRRPVDWRSSDERSAAAGARSAGAGPTARFGARLGSRPAVAGNAVGAHFGELDATRAGACPVSRRRSSCSGAPTPAAPGWPGCSRSRRAGCCTSATRRPPTAMSGTPTARRCTSPTTAR